MLEKREHQIKQILNHALQSVHAGRLLTNELRLEDDILHFRHNRISLKNKKRIFVIGAGKASLAMAEAFEEVLGDRITAGGVITKHQYGGTLKKMQVFEGGHPIIDESSLESTDKLLKLVANPNPDDLVLCLISGGGSALFEKFPDGIELRDVQQTTRVLINNGADIEKLNLVRKRLSLVKGGGLAELLAPAHVVSFILSDVIYDRLDVIASGPTVPDASSFAEAINILKLQKVWSRIPANIRQYLAKGKKNIDPVSHHNPEHFRNVTNILIGSNRLALLAAEEKAKEMGFNTLILTSFARGEAQSLAGFVTSVVEEVLHTNGPVQRPACLLLGGESTVNVEGAGMGGRNLEFSLAAAIHIRHLDHNVIIASIGTDGDDGPTPDAGALVTQYTFDKAMSIGINPHDYLFNNDSYNFFQKVGGNIVTGPTGTNVMDIIIAMVE
jgi:glycerate 2-kinase